MNAQPRWLLLRQSLLRPVLWFGGDRELTGYLWAAVAIICMIASLNLYLIGAALVLGATGQFVLWQWAKSDPLWWPIYNRNRRYNSFYPARSGVRAGAKRVTSTL